MTCWIYGSRLRSNIEKWFFTGKKCGGRGVEKMLDRLCLNFLKVNFNKIY